MKIKILIPVFNDWQSLSKLMNNIDNEIQNISHEISIIIVDDASTFDRQLETENLSNINSIKILVMKENRGHARCIATGLKYILEKEEFDYVIPMDGDGEDRPEEIKEFIKTIENNPDTNCCW
jgi:glycosyltransferase involved in cell wall biosynthesis